MKLRKTLLLIFTLLAAAVIGALIAHSCAGSELWGWLAFSRTIGFSPEAPLVLDLSVVRFSFGFLIDISVAQIITIAAAIVVYNLIIRKREQA